MILMMRICIESMKRSLGHYTDSLWADVRVNESAALTAFYSVDHGDLRLFGAEVLTREEYDEACLRLRAFFMAVLLTERKVG